MNELLDVRTFDEAAQQRFAALSRDVNPMHVDPVAARRTQAGAPVVHGVHAVLWGIDAAAAGGRTKTVAKIDVRFQKFVYVGGTAELRVLRESAETLRLSVVSEGLATATIILTFGASAEAAPGIDAAALEVPREPLALDLAELPQRCGRFSVVEPHAAAQLFPHAAALLGAERVASLVQLSTLVGMVCPGLHSIFSGFVVSNVTGGDEGLAFVVRSVDDRFRLAEIAVTGEGIAGTVTAFLRQPPVVQRTLEELRAEVAPQEFAGTTALIVGGSRGLGAVTARAIAAGGGRAIVTYVVGEAEARQLVAEIGRDACRAIRYDARLEPAPQLSALDWPYTQIYYFATTHIFRQAGTIFDSARFSAFRQVYVDGFGALCTCVSDRTDRPPRISVFYPSSSAVEERPREMTEYAMAKAAGEILAADFGRFSRGLRVVIERLPRILTDQTATVMPVPAADAADVMLPIIRRMHADQS